MYIYIYIYICIYIYIYIYEILISQRTRPMGEFGWLGGMGEGGGMVFVYINIINIIYL